ncbi:hypothetical protein [Halalkalicoccus jeotgali]|uniref:Uncharacterized protein n=1 Tax=Halalkalicoccus jeotgali (strain DSM 18796 / CECT 7217 / JCM 14584 / KCTC 4019 / B3) TaxID=795797 RepID=L9W0B3_HALJB|nr:hypothetical protein [Halalkalicoccus jeotgali]ELY41758.1 hypothetical protein C497_00685 [Halalkalicoccus jeotgali B3]
MVVESRGLYLTGSLLVFAIVVSVASIAAFLLSGGLLPLAAAVASKLGVFYLIYVVLTKSDRI